MSILDDVQQVAQSPVTLVIAATGAFAGLITAAALLLGAIPKLRRTEKTLETVHTIVNQQHTDLQRYIVALSETLRQAGIDIPVDQSLPVPGYTAPKVTDPAVPPPSTVPPQALKPTEQAGKHETATEAADSGYVVTPTLYVEVNPSVTTRPPEPE